MSDRSAPSVHVRHNIEALSVVFPPAYLLSFVIDHQDESIHGAADLPLYFRSRGMATLGLCLRTADFGEEETSVMAREIELFKRTRDALSTAAGALLTAQASPNGGPSWDIFQATASDNQSIVISAFQNDSAVRKVLFRPVGLRPRTVYEIRSVDAGSLGTATGAELMTDGIMILESPHSAAHVLVLTALPADSR